MFILIERKLKNDYESGAVGKHQKVSMVLKSTSNAKQLLKALFSDFPAA